MPPSILTWNSNSNPNSYPNPSSSPMISQSQLEQDPNRLRREWDFQLSTVVSPTTVVEAADVLGAIEFDPSDRLVATGGIARKIKIYDAASFLPADNEGPVCNYYICTPAKLSSLRWKPVAGSLFIGAADYDGVVTEYDVERRLPVFERDEHGGRRVWSVDYSRWAPHVGASGSGDGTAHLWDSRCHSAATAAVLHPTDSGAAVCSAEFDSADETRIGLGCADTNAYIYDIRMVLWPLSILRSHTRTVTYVRFNGDGRVVTASTDGTIKMWNCFEPVELRTFKGHTNTRSFVGLSLWRGGGLVGCGSESNEIYVYDMRWGEPIWVQNFGGGDDHDDPRMEKRFVSAIAWRHKVIDDECLAVAGGSDGTLQAWMGKRRRYQRI